MTKVLRNIGTLVTCPQEANLDECGEISNAALVWKNETILWTGPEDDLPQEYRKYSVESVADANSLLVCPGFIDCHTHLAFGGWRADEFALRCKGASYLEIAKAGGGILSTVRDTRASTEEELIEKCLGILQQMASLGVTTVECKSGYGLTLEDELKLLRVYRELEKRSPVRIVSTLLAAHMIPPEFKNHRVDYIKLICKEIIPQVAEEKLADFCDAFVEETALTLDEARKVLSCGKNHGLRPKLHVDQLSSGGGAELAAELQAVSADHLEFASDDGLKAMADAGVVAVALPLASLYTRQPPLDARKYFEKGITVAIATDFNPGSAPSFHIPMTISLACAMNRLTPTEALRGVTIHAAKAIDRAKNFGSLEPGKQADFVLLDVPSVNHLAYHVRPDVVRETYIAGERIFPV